MQTPDLDQIERWIDVDGDKPPKLEELQAIGAEIGKRRKTLRAQANEQGKLMRALVPVLFLEGMTNLAEMQRLLDTTYMTIDKELKKHGLSPKPRPPRGASTD